MFEINEILPNLEKNLATAIFIRHAEKAALADQAHDAYRNITENGKQRALLLADFLEAQNILLHKIITSPVLRCVQTAEAINIKFCKELSTATWLGDPGAYIKDPKLAAAIFEGASVEEVIHQLLKQEKLPGFYDIKFGSEQFFKQTFIHLKQNEKKTLLYVGHDAILMPFICYFSNYSVKQINWLDYLQGFVLQLLDSNRVIIHLSKDISVIKKIGVNAYA
jgi:broad specificity phosphatase PhoE